MAKKARKFLVLALAAILCIVSFAIPAMADDVAVEITEEALTVTTTVSNEGGDEVVTVTIERTEDVHVETSETTGDVQPGQDVPEVEVELVPGDPDGVTKTVTDTVTEVTGDLPESSEDDEFDFTVTETTTEREVTASASEAEITVTEKDNNLTALAPDQHDSSAYGDPDEGEGGGLLAGMTPDNFQSYADQVAKPDAEGYDFQWTGYAEATNEYRAVSKDVVYKKDADGNVMCDDNGEPIIESITFTGKYGDGMGSTPAIFTLTKYEENGTKSYYYGYCIDNDTEAVPGAWYKVSNLEDSDYYPDDESAAKLRAIVNNGYWGQNEGQGSVEQMKAALKEYYKEDATITIEDKDGNPLTIQVYDLFDNLTEGEALTITQAAIWTYANGSVHTNDGKDGTIIETLYSVDKPKANLANTDRDYNYESDARLRAAYEWLCAIAPQSSEDDTVTTIINEKNAVEDMSLVVGNKADHANNKDDNKDNDVYETGLKFTLAFTPDPETDDLLVKLIGEDGKTIKDADGNEIIRRLVGSAKEGETEYENIAPEADGSYILSGLQLQENSDFVFDLRLEGTQYLKEGVYIYSTEGSGAGVESQTMVGIASGERDVEVNVGMTLTFEVDEENNVVAERVWKKTAAPTTPPTTPREPTRTVRTTTTIDDEGVPLAASADELIEIIDEEVPLADAPETGDNSIIYVLMSIISLCGVALLMMKKNAVKGN